MIEFIKSIENLSCVSRYSLCHMSKSENVLEHSAFVALTSLYIGKIIKQKYDIDLAEVMEKSLVHDFEESVTGDILRPVKHSNGKIRHQISMLEAKTIDEISYHCGTNWLVKSWNESKSDGTGSIVSLCDSISVLFRFYDEVINRGNKSMIKYMEFEPFTIIKQKMDVLICYYPASAYDIKDSVYELTPIINELKEVRNGN